MAPDHAGRAPTATTRILLAAAALAALPPDPARGQAPGAIFYDGFEWASVVAWSGASPSTAPPEVCARPITDVDTSAATVVGTGTPASCSEAALDAALASNNGMIRFECGPAPHRITVTGEKEIRGTLVIDGGGRLALGGGTTRILALRPAGGPVPTLTVQNLMFLDGSTRHLPGTITASGGAAIFRAGGSHLRIIDCVFGGNRGPVVGQDVAGGAVYSVNSGTTTVVGSTFTGNECSSGGALGNLHNDLVVVNSVVVSNAATGNDGNPGNGGNGGGLYFDGNSQTVSFCGVTIADNDANARGGGIFRVSNNGIGPMTIDRSTISGNVIPDNSDSQAGGLYLQGLQTTITASTISGNVASSVGGAFVATNPGTQTLTMENVTVAGNHARRGLGAGLAVNGTISGSLRHVTIARNSNEGAGSFASAISGGNSLTVTNSIIADNLKVFQYEDVSCNVTHAGAGSVQWPAFNVENEPETPCAGVTFLDPLLGLLQANGGPTRTILPASATVRDSVATGCVAIDQRGVARTAPCTPGAVEMP